jgi:hypothetical protein
MDCIIQVLHLSKNGGGWTDFYYILGENSLKVHLREIFFAFECFAK